MMIRAMPLHLAARRSGMRVELIEPLVPVAIPFAVDGDPACLVMNRIESLGDVRLC